MSDGLALRDGPELPPATVGESVRRTAESLRVAGIEQPGLEASLLVALALNARREAVLAHPEQSLSRPQRARLVELVTRRLAREPMAYLRGEQEFYGRSFLVDSAVLIPRPETELLIEMALQAVDGARRRGLTRPSVLDVGTGSGAIAVSVALERPESIVVGLDLSMDALKIARHNAHHLGAANVRFIQGDLLASIRGPINLLLGNLPYVPEARRVWLQPELDYEPGFAIFVGPTGLELIERLLEQSLSVLAPLAEIVLEIDEEQGHAALQLAETILPGAAASVVQDHAGFDRLLHLRN